jgi:hypothetical protein
MKKLIAGCVLFLTLFTVCAQIAPDTVLDNFEKSLRIPNLFGTLKVTMTAANGDTREIQAKAYQKQMNDDQINRLFLFDFPPSVRGTGMLIHSFMNGNENAMWMYLPAVKRVKRIALNQSGGGYFMGSDFTYSDFIAKSRKDYNYEFIKEDVLNGKNCYVLKETAKTQSLQQQMGISYMVNYYNKENFVLIGRDYYDLAGVLLKEYRVQDITVIDGKHLYPSRITMINTQTKHASEIRVESISSKELSDSYFTEI